MKVRWKKVLFSGRRSFKIYKERTLQFTGFYSLSFPLSIPTTCTNQQFWPCSTHSHNSKNYWPIPSISLSMHPMMHEHVQSLRGLVHHCRMQDKKCVGSSLFSTLFFSSPTLSPPQSNPRARLQKYCRLQAFPSINLPVNIVVVVLFPIKILVVASTQFQKSLSPRERGRSKWITPAIGVPGMFEVIQNRKSF